MILRHIILIIIVISIILLCYLIIRKNTINEGFNDTCELVYDYENYPKGDPVYSSIDDCLEKNPNIITDDNIILYLINWPNGFGSALTVFIQNSYYLHGLNNKLHILPMFSINSSNFKYHDTNYHNTFFKYFKYTLLNTNIKDTYKVYYIQSSPVDKIPFFDHLLLPVMSHSPNREYINYFRSQFKLCIGNHIRTYIHTIKQSGVPLIGIHVRSIAQKHAHWNEYLAKGIEDRLKGIKTSLDNTYEMYNVFIATDVNSYLTYSKSLFKSVYYLDFISRIDNEGD